MNGKEASAETTGEHAEKWLGETGVAWAESVGRRFTGVDGSCVSRWNGQAMTTAMSGRWQWPVGISEWGSGRVGTAEEKGKGWLGILTSTISGR